MQGYPQHPQIAGNAGVAGIPCCVPLGIEAALEGLVILEGVGQGVEVAERVKSLEVV